MVSVPIVINLFIMLARAVVEIAGWLLKRTCARRWRRFASREYGAARSRGWYESVGLPPPAPPVETADGVRHDSLMSVLSGQRRGHVVRLWLCGQAGAGKSALISALAHGLAGDDRRLPVLVSASSMVEGHPFERAEHEMGEALGRRRAAGLAEALSRRAADGRVALLVDDLEHLTPSQRETLHERLGFFAGHFPQMSIVVCARPELAPARGFSIAHVRPLDALTRARWLVDSPAVLDRVTHRCAEWAHASDWLRNPLLLGVLAECPGGTESSDRLHVSGRAVDRLFDRAGILAPSQRASIERLGGVVGQVLSFRRGLTAAQLATDLRIAGCGDPGVAADLADFSGADAVVALLRDRVGLLVTGPRGLDMLSPDVGAVLVARHLDASPSRFEQLMSELPDESHERWDLALALYCSMSGHGRLRWGRVREWQPVLAGRVETMLDLCGEGRNPPMPGA